MTVLDTNVLSEVLRPEPSDRVLLWLARRPPASAYTTAITQAELILGVELMSRGRRRSALESAIKRILAEDFADRILPFDSEAAEAFAQIAASRKARGRPISHSDAQIAAIVRTHNATLVTRNTADFDHCGIKVLDPWVALRPE